MVMEPKDRGDSSMDSMDSGVGLGLTGKQWDVANSKSLKL